MTHVQFDEATRAAVHQFASPRLTVIMRGFSFVGSTIALTIGTIIVVIRLVMRKWVMKQNYSRSRCSAARC